MLKRLRRQFIVIVMTLVGTVLAAVLGSAYIATYHVQTQQIEASLEHGLDAGMDERIIFGNERPREDGPAEDGPLGTMLTLLVEIDTEGIVLQVNDAPVIIDAEVLGDVIERVISDGTGSGEDKDLHIAWKSVELDDGGWRIAIVDTSSSDNILHQQAVKDLQIIVIGLAALFAITWWLSSWVLKPVQEAWDQQRRFVADASHELKTPLAVILANTQILEKHSGVSDDAMRWVESTSDEATHMKALVGDLLQLARADEAGAEGSSNVMRHEDIDLSEMVESATLEFDAVAFERGCLLDSDVAEGIHVQGDPEWLERVVRILIDNACKYGSDGSTVTVRLAQAGTHPTLTVHNMGNPIDQEDLPHVFERFYRSDKARSREGEGGFGLGLAIAKGIVDSHGGEISVASTEAEGTTFKVVL